jgi:hypothetical protein
MKYHGGAIHSWNGVTPFGLMTARFRGLNFTEAKSCQLEVQRYCEVEFRDLAMWPNEKTEPKAVMLDEKPEEWLFSRLPALATNKPIAPQKETNR